MSAALLVANASGEIVVQAGAGLGLANSRFAFLPSDNPLLQTNAQQCVENLLRGGPNLNSTAISVLADYLALSTTCHLFAGWRYLGQSAYAMADAARHASLHLAYYAELRAAMAILASAGIGILDTCHFSINSQGIVKTCGYLDQCGSFPAIGVASDRIPTHRATWQCLKEWSQLPASSQLVLGQFNVFGRDGADWIAAFGASATTPICWLADWSIDLKSLK